MVDLSLLVFPSGLREARAVILGLGATRMIYLLVLFETINIAGLLDIDNIFAYANILLSALIPVVLLALGFALARYVVGFVMKVFNNQ